MLVPGLNAPPLSRRKLLELSSMGMGSLALAWLLQSEKLRAEETAPRKRSLDLKPKASDRPAKAKSVIMLVQNGGPSQMELFDPKPELNKCDGQTYGAQVETFQLGSEANKILGCPFKFHAAGRSGMQISEVLPNIASVADDLCLVRSMHGEHNNHTEGLVLLNTGKIFPGRPALGSWVSYALGSENQNLPAYIVLRDPEGYNTSGSLLWQNGWLPALYRGTEVSMTGTPVLNLQPQKPPPADVERANLAFLSKLNERQRQQYPLDSDLEARIRNYELAARMQLAASQTLDLKGETPETRRMYGLDNPETAGYGLRCLMARRLIESGVRFVQVFPPVKPHNQPWDSHVNVKTEIQKIAGKTDLPSAALIKDLKQRGLLDETIVIWSGEFGRLPISQNGAGRDHNRNAFSLLLAGGGFKAGYVHGATDDVGYRAVEKRVSVQDLHATILAQLGLDHDLLSYRHQGREETLTDSAVTKAKVVSELVSTVSAS